MKLFTRKAFYLVLLIVFAAILAFALSYYNYVEDSDQEVDRKKEELTSIANLKTKQLLDWRNERQTDARYLAGNFHMQGILHQFCKNPDDETLKNEITSWLLPLIENKEYADVILISHAYDIMISMSGKTKTLSGITKANIKKAASNDVFMSDFYLSDNDSAAIDIIIPFNCPESKICKLCTLSIVLKINPYFNLYPIIENWPTKSKSAGIALVEKDADSDSVKFLSKLRNINKGLLKFKISLNDTNIPAVKAVLGRTGLYSATDYLGTKVLAHSSKIIGTPWFMITKVDKAEINEPMLENQKWFAASISIIILLITISFWMMWSRNNSKNLRQLLEAQQQKSKAIAENLESNEKFRLLAEQSGIEIGLFDINKRCIYFNERALISLGERGINYENKTFAELFGEEAGKQYESRFYETLASEIPLTYEDKSTKPGDDTWFYSNLTKVIKPNGETAGIQIVSYDITHSKQLEKELKESEYFFRESQRAASIGSYNCDFVNDSWTSSEVLDNIFGIDKDYEHNVAGWLVIIHPDDREMMEKYLTEEILGKHLPFNKEYRIMRISDKAVRWMLGLGQLAFDAKGNVISMMGTIQDITERKLAELEVVQSNELLHLFLKNSPIYTYIKEVTATGSKMMMVNDKLMELFGKKGSDITGKTMHELFPADFADKMTIEDWMVISENKELTIEEELNNRLYSTIKFPISMSGKKLMAGYSIDITERKMSENILSESEKKFRKLYDIAPVAFALNDVNNKILLLNEAFINTIGYTLSDIPTLTDWWPRAYPDATYRQWVITNWRQRLQNARTTGKPFESLEVDIVCKDGVTRTFIVGLSFMGEIETSPALVFFHDITERKQAEKTFFDIVDKNPMSIQIVDLHGITQQSNPAMLRLFGSMPPEGFSIFDTLVAGYPELTDYITRAKLGEVVHLPDILYNTRDYSADLPDKPVWISAGIFPLCDSNGQPEKFVFMHENISERKLTEEIIKESESRFRTTFMTATDAMYLATLEEDLIITANDSFESVLGYLPGEVINKTSSELNLFANSLEKETILNELKKRGAIKERELKARKKNGEIIDIALSISTMKLRNKVHILGIIRDISFRKQSEKLLNEKIHDLEKSNEFMVDREMKMIELKKEINQLLVACGQEEKYKIF